MDRRRWFVLIAFFTFLLFHQADRFVISAVAPQVMDEFGAGYGELGLVFSLAGFIAALLYPVWGYLYDRYSRRLLVSLASLIWGATSLANALSRSFGEFFATRLSTAIDDAAPPGMASLVLDYYEPERRAKAIGLLNTTGPLGAILGSVLSLSLVAAGRSWREAFYVTGSVGVLTSLLIYVAVKDVPRGSSEPELRGLLTSDAFKAKPSDLLKLLRNRSLTILFLQGFWGVFPWAAINYWIITYMQVERGLLLSLDCFRWLVHVVVYKPLPLLARSLSTYIEGCSAREERNGKSERKMDWLILATLFAALGSTRL